MATILKQGISSNFTAVYDATVSGSFTGVLQTTQGEARFFVGKEPPAGLGEESILFKDSPVPLKLRKELGDKLFVRTYRGEDVAMLTSGVGPLAAVPLEAPTLAEDLKAGRLFETALYQASVADGTQIKSVMSTGAQHVIGHVRDIQYEGAQISTQVFKNPTYTGGTPLPIYNRNSAQPMATSVALLGGVTVSNNGTEVFAPGVGLAAGNIGGNKFSTTRSLDAQFILAPNTNYLFVTTAVTGVAGFQNIEIYALWSEVSI